MSPGKTPSQCIPCRNDTDSMYIPELHQATIQQYNHIYTTGRLKSMLLVISLTLALLWLG